MEIQRRRPVAARLTVVIVVGIALVQGLAAALWVIAAATGGAEHPGDGLARGLVGLIAPLAIPVCAGPFLVVAACVVAGRGWRWVAAGLETVVLVGAVGPPSIARLAFLATVAAALTGLGISVRRGV